MMFILEGLCNLFSLYSFFIEPVFQVFLTHTHTLADLYERYFTILHPALNGPLANLQPLRDVLYC